MRLLTYTTLYPNAVQFRHGIFVEQRLRRLLALDGVDGRVVAPVPWFPSAYPRFGRYATFARVPRHENRDGIEVLHPRYPAIPRVGMTLAPFLLASATLPLLRRMRDDGAGFDLIDAHYFYPDGVAAALLGAWLDRPVVITARGSDVNLVPRHALPRRWILWAARRAALVVTVSEALKRRLVELGVEAGRIRVFRNGVDLERFSPGTARRNAPGDAPHLLSVGNLVEAKGHHLVIEALRGLPGARLTVVGDGPERAGLERLASRLEVRARVTFVPAVPQDRLVDYYRAADMLVLASSREGWPNVLLEAMACGTPVVATAVGGIPEVVREAAAGVLVRERSASGLLEGIRALLDAWPAAGETRRYAERFSWDETVHGTREAYAEVTGRAGW